MNNIPKVLPDWAQKAIQLIGYIEGPLYSPKCEDLREHIRITAAALDHLRDNPRY